MEEMSAFERQIARVVQQSTMPQHSVDAMPIMRIATATSATRWRNQPLFSATKFVLAGAITAVFGGLLLAGMLATQGDDDQAPAAATDSPRPTTEELLSGMVTEEVEPSVVRVVSDGAGNELASLGIVEIAVDADGAVWTRGRSGLLRLGQGRPAGAPTSYRTNPTGLTVAVDGTVWAWDRGSGTIRSWDGEAWVDAHPALRASRRSRWDPMARYGRPSLTSTREASGFRQVRRVAGLQGSSSLSSTGMRGPPSISTAGPTATSASGPCTTGRASSRRRTGRCG